VIEYFVVARTFGDGRTHLLRKKTSRLFTSRWSRDPRDAEWYCDREEAIADAERYEGDVKVIVTLRDGG
jgi:hypothetical protein